MDTHTAAATTTQVLMALLVLVQGGGGVAAMSVGRGETCVTKEGSRGICSSKTMCPGEVKKLMAGHGVTMCPYDSSSYKLCCPLPHDNDIPGYHDPLSCITKEGRLGVCKPKAHCPEEVRNLRRGGDITMCPRNLFPSSKVCCPLSEKV